MINTDAASPAVASARQSLASALINEARSAVTRNDFAAADTWLGEARTSGISGDQLTAVANELAAEREKAAQRTVVGEKSLERIEYVPPKFPSAIRNRTMSGWVELEFTVRADGSTGDISVTNASPRRTFDSAAMAAVSQWRYKPVLSKDGKPIDQRAAVRIRFAGE
jgi:TonB family protein